jgi:hypothetical protein
MATKDTKDMVKFLMPDGTEVSADPRFELEQALEKMVNSHENKGDMGIDFEDQKAQTQVEHVANLQSGQPGVGENATLEDPVRANYGPLGSPAQQRQVEDYQQALDEGASPHSTSVEDDEPVDSNEAVLKARELRKEQAKKLAKAEANLDKDGPGDPEKPYTQWTVPQLKHEVARRNEGRNQDSQLSLKGLKKKAAVAKLLKRDDETQAAGSGDGPGGGGTPDTSSQSSDDDS